MTKEYVLPPHLDSEISQLEELIAKYRSGEVSAVELKARRVPFGVYEQREPDTYMVRIRCASGFISPSQLEKVSQIASRNGIGDLHITTRQELQIHYVKLDDVVPVMRALKEAGLSTRGGGGNTVRNIVAAPDAGIDPGEAFDVSPYAVALTTRLIAENDSWSLPRKFKIAFSGSAEDRGYATLSDVGFMAKIRDGERGFRVYAAGGLGAKPAEGKVLLDFIAADEVYPVAKALKNVFWKHGNRKNKHSARLRFLWQSLGEEEFRKKFQEEYSKVKAEEFSPLLVEENSVRPALSGLSAGEAGHPQDFELWKKRFVREQKQKGLFSILIPVELGFISTEETSLLARFLKSFGDDVLRMTKDQNFFLRNIPENNLGAVYDFLKKTIPNFNRPVISGRILSCAGASTCQLGICLSRQAAKVLIKTLETSGLDLDQVGDFKLNISGCPNSCGQHQAADLGFSGKVLRKDGRMYPAYAVFAGAVIRDGETRFAQPVGDVAAKNLPTLVKDLLGRYLSNNSRYKNFPEYMAGEGKDDLKEICRHYQDIPAFDEDKNYYYDWGAEALFSLAGRGVGECSAGLSDLMELDLNNIKETRKEISVAVDREIKKQLLRNLVYYASRMLLVTRGVEPKAEEEIFSAFLTHFVETGLVAASFKGIVEAARDKDFSALLGQEKKAEELAQAVETLYVNMDNGFNFNPLKAAGEPGKAGGSFPVPAVVKDLRGVACPLNFVKTKIELSKIKSGDVLEVWLDDGAPVDNVPGSVKAEGHKILAQKKNRDYWSVVIEKK